MSHISNQLVTTWRDHHPSVVAADRSTGWLGMARAYPAEKQDPAPRMIITEISGSASPARRPSNTAARRSLDRALRFSGRFRVNRRTRGAGSSTSRTDAPPDELWTEPVV